MIESPRPLRPVLDGNYWLTGAKPPLADLSGGADIPIKDQYHPVRGADECVDHHIYQDANGAWNLWACIRHTRVGRILYRWTAAELTDSPWHPTGEIIRADPSAGECIREDDDKEWLQSPFIVHHAGRYWMFYGGHSTGLSPDGAPAEPGDPLKECQICLMTSPDGINWSRHRNPEGFSRLFLGPGQARDPSIIRHREHWICYYAGHSSGDRSQPAFYARTSHNLTDWSDPTLVHRDPRFGHGPWNTECPFVIHKEGFFYLFRTRHYYSSQTFVYRSSNPFDFGRGDARPFFVSCIDAAAPEIITDSSGQEFLSSSHQPGSGQFLARLKWIEDF